MKLILLYIILLIGCSPRTKSISTANKPESTKENIEVPRHKYFVKEEIKWNTTSGLPFGDSIDLPLKIGAINQDTMLILTPKKLIYVFGQYSCWSNDTIRMPYSGEFGINFNIQDNNKYNLDKDSVIIIDKTHFIQRKKTKFQWWGLLKNYMSRSGFKSIQVSGP